MAYQFASNVCGIPCIIRVDHYFKQLAWRGSVAAVHNCPSDWDYYGYEEIDYSVLDRKGYPAAWLECKITPKEHNRITEEISKVMREECEAMMGDY